jgi:hypothetical protein
LATPKIDDARHRLAIDFGNQDVRRLQIAMDNGLLVRVLHALAHLHEQLQPLPRGELVPVAIFGDRESDDVLHYEPRGSVGEGVGVVQAGDGGVIELGQSTLFGGETLAPGGREPGVSQDFNRDQVA